MIAIKDNEFQELVKYMREKVGINLEQKKNLVEGRLSNHIVEIGYESFTDYLDYVFSDLSGHEISLLINKLTTNHTFFLREPQHFEFLVKEVLPALEKTVKDRDLRIWSAGCSSGEEPYTLAMVMQDYFKETAGAWDKKVLATDISIKVLEQAIRGAYPKEGMENIPGIWKVNYFKNLTANTVAVNDKIKNEVIFRVFNLMESRFPFKRKFHIIFCRNVMIYFDAKTKAELFKKYYDATEPGGYLFIGHSESIGKENPGFKYIMPSIYQKG